ncbi:ATP12 family chaperone protein [Sphingomonas sp. SUN039]|uniref:ATP12 family chaperone protein n=1 Tax=Sphingomonas sp. SUN039 TaxID=2937787 RepID=UPI002164BAE1|nr:ATP12 family protein [Sphingomonas sp. SUN039]UVO55018.1 ATPase [Sphingomonas sp. SUN039]
MKRFWKDVTVADSAILLDGRAMKTPARAPLILPTAALAEAVADEWRAVGDKVDPRAMPLTGFANAAIDKVAPDVASFAAGLAAYGETDLLCYRAENPPELAARQAEIWDPLLDWARTRYDIAVVVTAGIVHRAQPPETLVRLSAAIAARSPFELAALSPVVSIGGSLVVALMLAEAAIAPDAAFDATHLDELWQAELWGEEWMAADARALRRADFVSSGRMLELLRAA